MAYTETSSPLAPEFGLDPIDLSSHPHVRGHDWRVVKYTAIATAVLLAAMLTAMLYGLYGPSPPLKIPNEIDGEPLPLRADGSSDLEQYILDRGRAGVTPETNAAIPFLRAVWPMPLREMKDIQRWDAVTQAMGAQTPRAASMPAIQSVLETYQMDKLNLHQTIPWNAKDDPQLAAAVEADRGRLELLIEASSRSGYWLPSWSLLNGRPDSAAAILLPHIGSTRWASRWMHSAAMLELGQPDPAAAWKYLHTSFRLASLFSREPYLIGKLVAASNARVAFFATRRLLAEPQLPPQLLEAMAADLAQLDLNLGLWEGIRFESRVFLRDIVANEDFWAEYRDFTGPSNQRPDVQFVWGTRLDRNRIFDRAEEALRAAAAIGELPTRREQSQAIESWKQRYADSTDHAWFTLLTSSAAREELIADWILEAVFPHGSLQLSEVEDLALTSLDLLRVSVALRRHAADQGRYPQTLEELTPRYRSDVPSDRMSSGPLGYAVESGGGCVLWSVGTSEIVVDQPPSEPSLQELDEFLKGQNFKGPISIRLPPIP